MKPIVFKGKTLSLQILRYNNGRMTLELAEKDGSRFATATVNIPEEPLGSAEIIVKDYNENKGVVTALVTAGVIKPPKREIPCGHATAHVCEMTAETQEAAAPKGHDVLDPDGMPCSEEPFKTITEAEAFKRGFVTRFRQQGYYSSITAGRIPYERLEDRIAIAPAA